MAEHPFKVVVGTRDWGSPLGEMPAFTTLEDAEAAAREYIREQKSAGGLTTVGAVMIEETRQDGSVVSHPVG